MPASAYYKLLFLLFSCHSSRTPRALGQWLIWENSIAVTLQHWSKQAAKNGEALDTHMTNSVATVCAYTYIEACNRFDEFDSTSVDFGYGCPTTGKVEPKWTQQVIYGWQFLKRHLHWCFGCCGSYCVNSHCKQDSKENVKEQFGHLIFDFAV
jgi:hypothetical protein